MDRLWAAQNFNLFQKSLAPRLLLCGSPRAVGKFSLMMIMEVDRTAKADNGKNLILSMSLSENRG